MAERPILFSGSMVSAILAGTKTQTRRVVKASHPEWVRVNPAPHHDDDGRLCYGWDGNVGQPLHCPYGQPGDLLWVRETWRVRGGREYEYQQDRGAVMYRATHQEEGFPLTWESYDWRPSIHMPRWASRITLRVTDVRVERLQEISEADAVAEGCEAERPDTAVGAFEGLWESINGPGSWDANPLVWALTFERAGGANG